MGLFEREFIAAPDERKGQLVYKHPDTEIRRFTRLTVNADQRAVFVKQGVVMMELGPGRHVLDADELPGLGALIDNAIGRNVYKAELYFVLARELASEAFGGRVDDVRDPQTGLLVSLRVFGEYSLVVSQPAALVTRLAGTVDVTRNATVTDWVDQLLLKTMKTEVTRGIVRGDWPVLGLSAFVPELEHAVVAATNEELDGYGLAIARLGAFDINLSDDDLLRLKELSKDQAYSQLAGSYSAAAQAEMMKGFGKGAESHGPGTAGAFIGTGLAATGAQQAFPVRAADPAPAPAAAPLPASPAAAGASRTCGSCGATATATQRFCSDCGTALAAAPAACVQCAATLVQGAKFCGECGTPVAG